MRRLRRGDLLLLASLLGLWTACAALHLKQVARGQLAWVGVYVSAGPDGHPIVRGAWPGATRDALGELRVGDRVIAAGGVDLRGAGPFSFGAHVHAAAAERRALRVPIAYERHGTTRTTTIALVPVAFPWRMLPVAAMMAITGALVLARRPEKRIARAVFLPSIAFALHWTFFFGGPPMQTYVWTVVFFFASLVFQPLVLRAMLIFPAEIAPRDRPVPRWPWLFAVFGPISLSWIYGVPFPPAVGFHAVFVVNVLFIATMLAVVTRNFRRAGPLGRRQLKWVVLGFYLGTVPVLLTDAVAAVMPALWWVHEVAVIAEICIPLSILIAIVRTNFLDVDRLITGAAVYSLLSVLVLAAVLIAVPQLARAASRAGNLDQHTVQLALSIAVAAGILPAQRLLAPIVERVLFRERWALRTGVEDLLRDLAAVGDAERLLTTVGARLDALVRPQTCVIYAMLGDRFAPVFERVTDGAGPPELSADAAIVHALRSQGTPLLLERWTPTRDAAPAPGERAALERLRAAALLPVRRGDELAAVICLGTKRSGDVYTATDVTLLAAVADKVSSELVRFDVADVLRHERATGEALRSYVPEAIAARLTRGQPVEGGECDVSVLFVDIRGYTRITEGRPVGAVFSIVNRCAEAMSAVIQQRGGTVLEFLGDGLMAVFGAPDPLPQHARVAVEAARDVVATVRRLALVPSDGDGRVAVGVGIASGRAFVGNIRTSDRFVYTAVGDVVNLAARIQALTRDLEAAVAIDARTHRSAGDSTMRFRRHERVTIRGRAEPVDVYALPLNAA